MCSFEFWIFQQHGDAGFRQEILQNRAGRAVAALKSATKKQV